MVALNKSLCPDLGGCGGGRPEGGSSPAAVAGTWVKPT